MGFHATQDVNKARPHWRNDAKTNSQQVTGWRCRVADLTRHGVGAVPGVYQWPGEPLCGTRARLPGGLPVARRGACRRDGLRERVHVV
jgi:hypothetical protein